MFYKFIATKKIKKIKSMCCLYLAIIVQIKAAIQDDNCFEFTKDKDKDQTAAILVTPKTRHHYEPFIKSPQNVTSHSSRQKLYQNNEYEYAIISYHNTKGVYGGVSFHPIVDLSLSLKILNHLSSKSIPWFQDNKIYELNRFLNKELLDTQKDEIEFKKGIIKLILSISEFGLKFSPHGMAVVTNVYFESILSIIGIRSTRVGNFCHGHSSNNICLYISVDEGGLQELKKMYGYLPCESFLCEPLQPNDIYNPAYFNVAVTRAVFLNSTINQLHSKL